MQQQFQIENFRFIAGNKIYVSIIRDKLSMPITIPVEQYELWLLTSQRLITTIVLYDEENNTQLADAVMSKEEYWNLKDEEIHQDLYDYITSHPIVFRNRVYNNSLVSINYGFNSHKSTMN